MNKIRYENKNKINSFMIIIDSLDNKSSFLLNLKDELLSLDKSYNYKLEYCLYLHTNDVKKEIRKDVFNFGLGDDFGNKSMDEMFKYLLANQVLYREYKYRGYHVFHNDKFNLKDFDSHKDVYLNRIYETLGNIIVETNETLDKDGFIEFKRPLVLIVSKDNNIIEGAAKFGQNKRSYSTMVNKQLLSIEPKIELVSKVKMDSLLKEFKFDMDDLIFLANEMGMDINECKIDLLKRIIKYTKNRDEYLIKDSIKDIQLSKKVITYKDGLLAFNVYVLDMTYLSNDDYKKIVVKQKSSLPIKMNLLNADALHEIDESNEEEFLIERIDDFFNDVQEVNSRGFVIMQPFQQSSLIRDFIPALKIDDVRIDLQPVIYRKIINIIVLNTLIKLQLKIGKYLELSDSKITDVQAGYKNIYKKLMGMLDPLIRMKIQKKGIVTIQNTYIGFDTEYDSIDVKQNSLLSAQLAVNTKSIIKIPKNELLTKENSSKESDVIKNLSGFNNEVFNDIINDGILKYRSLKHNNYDLSIKVLKDGLYKFVEDNTVKCMSDDNYDVFSFPRTPARKGIYLNTDGTGFTLSDLINESKDLVREDINKTYESLIDTLKNIFKGIKLENEELDLLMNKDSSETDHKIITKDSVEDDSKRLSRTKMSSFTSDVVNVTKIKNIYLIAHLTNADLSMLNDFEEFKEKLDIVNSSFVTLGKPLLINNNRIFIRDTMLLSPAGNRSLESIGKLYKVNKVDLGVFNKSKLSVLMKEDLNLFKEYAIRDALIALIHACFMEDFNFGLNKMGIPLTLSSLGTSYVKHKWDLIKYKGYQIDPDIFIGDTSKLMTPRGLRSNLEVALFLPLFIAAYKGGRNECFMYGTDDKIKWVDYDLTSAYTTAMASIGDPLYHKAVKLNKGKLEKLSDDDLINSFTIIKADFIFPLNTKFPSIPVYLDDTTTVYPLQGSCIITGIEYVLAKNQGCKFDNIREAIRVPFGKIKPFEGILNEIQSKRREYPKGDINNLLYKEMGNSIYGNSVRGISDKRKYDIRSGTYIRMEASELSNPLIGSWITAFIRSVLGECLHNINKLGGKVVSCTTDGFVTNIENLESLLDKCKGSNLLIKRFQEIRNNLSGDSTGLEVKHTGIGIISWSTRGQFSIDSGIAATTGFQRKQFDAAFIDTLFRDTLSKNDKSIEFIQQRLRSALDIYRNGGHVTKVYADRLFRLQFDNRREIIVPTGMENNTDFSNKMFDSNPVIDISIVKYLRDMSKINFNSVYDKRIGSLRIGSNKYQDYTDLAIRNFIKSVLNGNYGDDIKFDNYESLINFIKGYKPGFRISKSSISHLKHRPLILKSIPMSEDVSAFVKYVKNAYPNFKGDVF